MSIPKETCRNCEQPLQEGYSFCPNCGQKTNEELTLGVLFYNTISNYFSFDARFFKSFIPLMFRPGYLAKEFIKGKRLMYLHPAQMYLFIAVIFFFVFNFYVRDSRAEIDKGMQSIIEKRENKDYSFFDKDSARVAADSVKIQKLINPLKANKETLGLSDEEIKALDSLAIINVDDKKNINTSFTFREQELDSLIAIGAPNETLYKSMGMDDDAGYFKRKLYAQALKFYKTMGLGQIYQTFIDSIPLAMFFLLPIFAFLLKIFFYNKGRYAHHLVFSFYYFSFLFTVFSIVFAVNRWVLDIPDVIDWLIALSTFFYLFFAINKFYEQHWILSFIKSSVVSFLFLLFVLPFSFVILGFIAFLFY
ncbi:DUF3667 domain-containing protein [Winogradskyella sp. SYSU M77433]|uniref:DUF3667 domain-containing protein n=1 Tax=Winogradskyella sp. SYSU M77433 TaxID=3042722 RepID=UPI00247FC97C|nr:DUF3667 domain-containing protein [Winogradskyella sp. SYSU M77433]MDH7912611.1 DUF3667 domain-containing protein [Winogradskyella sp. SYSU M77433]